MRLASVLSFMTAAAAALDVDLDSPDSIKAAAKKIAWELMSYYHGNESGQTPGILPGPPPAGDYYWWEAGALWGTMMDYYHFTNDSTYNNVTTTAMLFQAEGPCFCYMPKNWTASLGNDDQGFWGLSAMLAAENKFPDPPPDEPQWLSLAQAVFNTQASPDRHDDTCGGGLRWQIPPTNNGYNYKNSIANGIFFNMGARLARYTRNQTYFDWAKKTWDWEVGVGFMDKDYNVYDGGDIDANCTDLHKAQFSYNAAVWMQGAAFMYNYTNGSAEWQERVAGIVNRTINLFFSTGAAVELPCELKDKNTCKTDMYAFKGFLHRWMANTAKMAPFTHDTIMPVLKKSAAGAMKACSGPPTGYTCGFRWNTGTYDGSTGAGQEMSALAALLSLLVDEPGAAAPVTNFTGGTSKGNNDAGSQPVSFTGFGPVTTRDRAGAGILTALVLAGLLGTLAWMTFGWAENGSGSRKWKVDGKRSMMG
ncbi:hypothetical protein VTK73DRAFT_6446 [Phialemonium thermophilum]|uniref:Mannan endo-1,6-alpha-mannosidase n=1 Tax=Phialemonium thermophilum TaxID=223376 RepID=A0ABR3WJM0_9PEZI